MGSRFKPRPFFSFFRNLAPPTPTTLHSFPWGGERWHVLRQQYVAAYQGEGHLLLAYRQARRQYHLLPGRCGGDPRRASPETSPGWSQDWSARPVRFRYHRVRPAEEKRCVPAPWVLP